MIDSNAYLVWQFIAVVLFFVAFILAYGFILKQKEVNDCFKERLDLLNECNKLLREGKELRKQLKEKIDELKRINELN